MASRLSRLNRDRNVEVGRIANQNRQRVLSQCFIQARVDLKPWEGLRIRQGKIADPQG